MANGRFTPETSRLDDAARAGWLYYVAGNTQDEIARKLGVSRQSAQRLVAMAVSEKLVKVRLDHPIARCMDLAQAIKDRFGIEFCEIVPSDPDAPNLLTGAAIAAAAVMERTLNSKEGKIIALGTGRALKATVEQVPRMNCPQHRVVSRLGNMMADGSATPYNATIQLADRVGAVQYPYPLPCLATSPEDLQMLHKQDAVQNTLSLCENADLTLVGIGQMDTTAPIYVDGFLSDQEMAECQALGAAGEITSWIYDDNGEILDCAFNSRVASAPLKTVHPSNFLAVAVGPSKVRAINAALRGNLVSGLFTNESTAEAILAT
ncbi:DNA-binding transcriptional regulator [Marivivens niveibacter]|uniref:DNA-binding transcriptional regulator n=1 Tax=Marivivens niveibacter TaxID=1930667 RepID=A0A251WXV2_9RHOB|nr:sugar-binding transcriptional regulator [Marivivens niveibacter]OUD09176.1 DNA-binding transcriptional regulator [Marivivens niveibacter]